MNKNKKQPRPLGATLLAIKINSNKECKKEKNKLINIVLQQYVYDGYRYNNQLLTLTQLSQMLDVGVGELVKEIGRVGKVWFNVRDRDRVSEGLGMMVMKLMEATMMDRAEIEDNLRGLKRSLGNPQTEKGTYKAFVSAEVNRALSLNIASHKSMVDTANLLMKLAGLEGQRINQPTINITQTNEANQISQANYLTTENAISLLAENKGQVLVTEGKLIELEAEYIDDEVPDINPLTQVGYGSDKSEVNLKKKADRIGHEDRREGRGEIVS